MADERSPKPTTQSVDASRHAEGESPSELAGRQNTTADSPSGATPEKPRAGQQKYMFTPPIDIYETAEGLVLQADLPGVSIDTLELEVQDNKLTLFGRVTSVMADHSEVVHCEYSVGDFLRSFILSGEVDHERIGAKLNNGVLTVELPPAQRAQPRRISVSTD